MKPSNVWTRFSPSRVATAIADCGTRAGPSEFAARLVSRPDVRSRALGSPSRRSGSAQARRIARGDDGSPNPDEKLIERWREPLFKALTPSPASIRHQSRRNDPQSVTRRAGERARRDAAALASVTVLNEAGLQAGSERGWRAILISGDEHLHRVYSRWAWETSGSSLRPERYVLRRPLQFTPVLNMASMSKDPATADIFKKLTNALDLTVDMLLDQPGECRTRICWSFTGNAIAGPG